MLKRWFKNGPVLIQLGKLGALFLGLIFIAFVLTLYIGFVLSARIDDSRILYEKNIEHPWYINFYNLGSSYCVSLAILGCLSGALFVKKTYCKILFLLLAVLISCFLIFYMDIYVAYWMQDKHPFEFPIKPLTIERK